MSLEHLLLQKIEDINKQHEWISQVVDSHSKRASDLERRVKQLEVENTELNTVCRALLHTLIDRDIITKENFIQLARQIAAETSQQYGRSESGILPKPEIAETPIKIDFTTARQKPESLNG
jgi:phage shock protein A